MGQEIRLPNKTGESIRNSTTEKNAQHVALKWNLLSICDMNSLLQRHQWYMFAQIKAHINSLVWDEGGYGSDLTKQLNCCHHAVT